MPWIADAQRGDVLHPEAERDVGGVDVSFADDHSRDVFRIDIGSYLACRALRALGRDLHGELVVERIDLYGLRIRIGILFERDLRGVYRGAAVDEVRLRCLEGDFRIERLLVRCIVLAGEGSRCGGVVIRPAPFRPAPLVAQCISFY